MDWQPEFAYSICGSLAKNIEKIWNFKEIGDSRYLYQNKVDKACFQHHAVYKDFKDMPRRTASNKLFPDKAFIIAKFPSYDGYLRRLASIFW